MQEKWLYLEPILTVEDIVRHLAHESILFREVDANWKTVMDTITQNPKGCLTITQYFQLLFCTKI